MKKNRLPNSIRKYIRKEKARIRRDVFDYNEQEKMISAVYQRFLKKKESSKNQRKNCKEDKIKKL